MIATPRKYRDRCAQILSGDICDNPYVKYIVDLKDGWLYMDEYSSFSCESWKEVLEVLEYSERA